MQQGAASAYARSMYGGSRITDKDDLQGTKPMAALSTATAQTAQKAAGQQQHQAETAWSLLGKMYSSQVLAYMVAITDAQALIKRMRSMRPGPPLHLPGQVQCMDVWQVLQGTVQQQRAWTFGLQEPAALPATAATELDEDLPAEQYTLLTKSSSMQPADAANAPGTHAEPASLDLQSLVEPCVSSREPRSIKDGVNFISCAAGHQHSAAAAEGGFVFTWGSNDKGQLGCDTSTDQPIAVHILSLEAQSSADHTRTCSTSGQRSKTNSTAAAGSSGEGPVAASARVMLTKLDSLKQLGSAVKLPPSLMSSLLQQRELEVAAASEQQEQQALLLQELLQHPELGQQQQLAGKPPVPEPGAAQAAAHMAVLSGLHTTSGSAHQQRQQQEETRPQALVVYQLHLGQAVRSVACGAHHTLAALASSGLMGWGLNDKGQLGAPSGLYREVCSPMRIHGFDGQRLVCISAGAKHSAAVQEGGVAVTWGHGRAGRLGVGGTPDTLPPSVVSGLRGCCITQVACGTAHTLALTADGRVYACGYNGQGALGTGDQQDRLYPVLVPGLPCCKQIAAAACSMALSQDGQVFVWGGAAGRLLQAGSAAGGARSGGSASSCSGSSSQPISKEGCSVGDLGVGGVQKACVPWLAGVRAVHITCGVALQAAVSDSGELLLWGDKQCMPTSMLGKAQVLGAAVPEQAAVRAEQVTAEACVVSAAQEGARTTHGAGIMNNQPARSCTTKVDGTNTLPLLGAELLVQPLGHVKLVLTCLEVRSQQSGQATHSMQKLGPAGVLGAGNTGQSAGAKGCGAPQQQHPQPQQQQQQQQQGCGHGADQGFSPQEEPIADIAGGASHQVVLCQPSQHTPSNDELRTAVLSVLRAFISSFNSSSNSSLNFLMQQQLQHAGQSEANWAGSIAGGIARSTKSARPGGMAASVVPSFVGSSSGREGARGGAASSSRAQQQQQQQQQASIDRLQGDLSKEELLSTQESMRQRAGMKGGMTNGHSVSFAGGTGDDPQSVESPSASGSKAGLLSSKADRAAGYAGSVGYAASMAAGSTGRGPAGSVAGTASGSYGSTGAAPTSDCLNLHGALMLCKEVGLLDNITEHLDVIQTFQLMLHRKRGRLGPVHSAALTATPVLAGRQIGTIGTGPYSLQHLSASAVHSDSTQMLSGTASTPAVPTSCNHALDIPQDDLEPSVLTVVHVLHPNERAQQPALAASDGGEAAAAAGPQGQPSSRPGTSGALGDSRASAGGNSRPGSSGVLSKWAAGRAAAAASGMDSTGSLDAGEVLEMLLLVMKDRHPCYRRNSPALLQMLAGWHVSRLKDRRPDQGPPWLLRQALQPDILSALESPATTEMLHGIHVHLAGSSANPQDLSMHLSDIRLGLRFAAGFRTPQELEQQQRQQQQQQQRQSSRRLLMHVSSGGSTGSRRLQPRSSSMQRQSYATSTESSRIRSTEPIPYSPSMHPSLSPGNSLGRARTGSANTPDCPAKAFQLPLYKVAAFIRTAKLLPRLLDKYIAQLQLKGQEQRVNAGGRRVDGLPVMPCLQLQVQQSAAGGVPVTSQTGLRRRAQDSQVQQLGLQGEFSRLAPLKEVSAASVMSASSAGQRQSSPAHPTGSSAHPADAWDQRFDGFFEPLPNQRFEGSQHAGGNSIGGSSSSFGSKVFLPGALTRRGATDAGGRTAREQQQGLRGRPGGKSPVMQPLHAGMIDASSLNSAELLPIRSNTPCVQLVAALVGGVYGAAARVRSAGGSSGSSTHKVVLPLPAAGSSKGSPSAGSGSSGRASSSGGQASDYGSEAWKEVNEAQKQQERRGGAAQGKSSGKATTYQQQQAALQQKQQADAASARFAEAQQDACQDAWIVCVLFELTGSSLVAPTHCTAVRLPSPPAEAAHDAASTQPPPGQALLQVNVHGADVICSWDRGYCFSAGETSCAEPQSPRFTGRAAGAEAGCGSSSSGGGGGTGSCSGGGILDLLNHCISYPQFVEVLLCLMAARSVSILEPDVKQIRGLAFDEEMQDHARVVMERITKWRATQLTPWKQRQHIKEPSTFAQSSPLGAAHASSSARKLGAGADKAAAGPGASGAAAAPIMEGHQVVCRIYAGYSSMKAGSSVLGLHRDGYLQLLRESGMLGASSSGLELAEAINIFNKAATPAATSAAACQAHQGSFNSAADTCPDSSGHIDSSSDRPAALGLGQRQSTFMRCVTQQLQQRLEGGLQSADVARTLVEQSKPAGMQDLPAAPASMGPERSTAGGSSVEHPHTAVTASHSTAESEAEDSLEQDTESGDEACLDSTPSSPQQSSRRCSSTSSRGSASTTKSTTSSPEDNCRVQSAKSATRADSTHEAMSSCPAEPKLHAVAGGAAGPASAGMGQAAKGSAVLTAAQFMQAMVLLSRRCFPRIANGARAWKLLLQHHVQPLADRKHGRYDQLAASLSTPGVVALLSAWGPQLEQLHADATAAHDRTSAAAAATQQQQQQQPSHISGAVRQQHQQEAAGGPPGLSLSAFLEVLQDKGVIPQLLEPADVQEVLRQLLVAQSNQDVLFSSLGASQFSQALAMCGVAAFASRRMQHSHIQAPEQQLMAFLTFMGLLSFPGQQQQLGVAARTAGTSNTVTGRTKGAEAQTNSSHQLRQQLSSDPYIEWWSLEFDPAVESKAHDHLSTLHYMPVMLQEVVQAPSCCPEAVLPLLSAAASAQQARDVDDALHLLELAEEAWRDHLQEQQLAQHHTRQLGPEQPGLPSFGVLYLAVTAAGCLLSAGRDSNTVDLLQGCADQLLTALHEAGADAAVWHAAAGVAKYHCGDLQGAFEHCVRAYVIRTECGSLGLDHPDTAAAGHNLGLVLDCLGKCSRGLQLVQEAKAVFAAALGPQHIRTLVAARNEQHIKHKIIKFPTQPQELLAGDTAICSNPTNHLATNYRQSAVTASTGKVGKQQAVSSAKAHSSRGYQGSASGADSDSSAGSSASDANQRPAGTAGGQRNAGKGQAGTRGRRDSRPSRSKPPEPGSRGATRSANKAARSLQHNGSMQERLQGVMQARQHNEAVSQGQQGRAVVETRDYTDPAHLGAGVFKATPQQQQLYTALLGDIKAHAQGISSSSYMQQPGRVELQVFGPPATSATGISSAGGAGGFPAGSAAGAQPLGRLAAASEKGAAMGGSSIRGNSGAASAARIAGAVGRSSAQSLAIRALKAASSSAGSMERQREGSSGKAHTPPASHPAASAGVPGSAHTSVLAAGGSRPPATAAACQGNVRHLYRGPLADATIAAVKKPLGAAQARRLKRQQAAAAAAAKKGLSRPSGPDMLDKLY